jgi:phosphoglycolate phosphatase
LNLVFDLDGTLLDAKPRLYRLFQHLAPYSQLSEAQYWAYKKQGMTHEVLLSTVFQQNATTIAAFVHAWMALIESPAYLELDQCIPGVHAALADFSAHARLHVCTARQWRQPAWDQLKRLDLLPYFDQVLVTEQQATKQALIAQHVPDLQSHDWVLGDTGKDIQVGKALKLRTCAVLSGFMDRAHLARYTPDCILDSVTEFQIPAA